MKIVGLSLLKSIYFKELVLFLQIQLESTELLPLANGERLFSDIRATANECPQYGEPYEQAPFSCQATIGKVYGNKCSFIPWRTTFRAAASGMGLVVGKAGGPDSPPTRRPIVQLAW